MALNQGWWAVPFPIPPSLLHPPISSSIHPPTPSLHHSPTPYPSLPMPSPQLLATARQVMADPALKQKLADRVLELMQEDLRLQRERARSYGGLRS